jgi:hypothetical protein
MAIAEEISTLYHYFHELEDPHASQTIDYHVRRKRDLPYLAVIVVMFFAKLQPPRSYAKAQTEVLRHIEDGDALHEMLDGNWSVMLTYFYNRLQKNQQAEAEIADEAQAEEDEAGTHASLFFPLELVRHQQTSLVDNKLVWTIN